jgi:chemotaxis signal transduction protein
MSTSRHGPYLVFEIGVGALFALTVDNVWQVIEPESEPSPVPLAPSFVRGIISHHGRIVTVVDPASIFGLPPQSASVPQIVVLRLGRRGVANLGLQSMRSHGIVPESELKMVDVEKAPCVAWVAQAGRRLIQIVEVEAFYEQLSEQFGREANPDVLSAPAQGVTV